MPMNLECLVLESDGLRTLFILPLSRLDRRTISRMERPEICYQGPVSDWDPDAQETAA